MGSVKRGRILLVDDEPNALTVYAGLIEEWGHAVVTASGTLEAMEIIRADQEITAALVDLKMPPPDGMDLFRWIKTEFPDLPVIILTAHGSIDSAVETITQGAFHYLTKPPEPEQMRSILDKAQNHVAMTREIKRLKEQLAGATRDDGEPIGRSPAFLRCLEMSRAVADSEAPVLILGETGTGKEVVARYVHRRSRRAENPFVSLNCGALPPTLLESELFGHEKGAFTGALASRAGRFEEADGGTIFLDEIGDCSPDLQVKLLRVLEEKRFCRLGSNRSQQSDFRLLAATNRDLGGAVKAGTFRQDLYFRVNLFEISLPPLRERLEDLPDLSWHFIHKVSRQEGRSVEHLSPTALEHLMNYSWPGNIRELENVIHRAVILAQEGEITPDHLPPSMRGGSDGGGRPGPLLSTGLMTGKTLSECERIIIRTTLARFQGNKSRAAKALGISRKLLYAKMDPKDSEPKA